MPRGYPKLLSIIVPVYKQEKTVVRDVRAIIGSLELMHTPYEVVVVVDGIVDKSYDRIKTLKHPRLHVHAYQENKGKGYAVRFGMSKSKGDVIGFIDAGGDLLPEGLPLMLEHFRWYNADIIVGSKLHSASKVHYPWQRKVLSLGYRLLIKMLFDLDVRDSQVGMKIFRREVLEDVLPRLVVKEFAFDIEILAVARHLGYTRIYDAPVELDFTGASSITSTSFWNIIYKMLWDTVAVFYRLRVLKYYDTTNKPRWSSDPQVSTLKSSKRG